jgi:uncharacterized membrane protein (UPF0127 family)
VRDSGCGEVLRCLQGRCDIPPAIRGESTEFTPVVEFVEPSGQKTDSSSADADAAEITGSTVARFFVEVADTTAERSRGLMHRRTMADGWGMLFVYPGEEQRAFWMKNTLIPLDIIFVSGAGRVVHIARNATPQTLERRRSQKPARYAVEVKAGVAKSAGVEVGHMVRFEHIATRHRPSR